MAQTDNSLAKSSKKELIPLSRINRKNMTLLYLALVMSYQNHKEVVITKKKMFYRARSVNGSLGKKRATLEHYVWNNDQYCWQ